ncbi:nucleotidyltransferase [Geobacter hydrogenophilus]|uniref:Nucleotidyltransferase n=1 Tax=Geobacter hydrogenophilus TaxID=40983 RepID=A0A9W6LC67_9BACT|nr:putative nucleotidyltransferase substrate binding domain-containing protein [Geobacter hydrogenophilus]MBT0893773.1 nucleotidyltransferase [Geobacter hydrogenophilus]GLI37529.1 nucleotidyltransferase [Geobacter hydrogenophilus]
MALLLGAKGEDLLTRRGTAEFVEQVRQGLYARMAHLSAGDEELLLLGVRSTLEEELAAEQRCREDFSRALDETDQAEDVQELILVQDRLRAMAVDHFRRRGSVTAFHLMRTVALDRITGAALRITVSQMAVGGVGLPAGRWCWMALGSAGRGEVGRFDACDFLLVHEGNEAGSSFVGFSGRGAGLLERLGIRSRAGITPASSSWRGSLAEWRQRIAVRALEGGGDLDWLIRLADLRLVAGDPSLAAEMVNVVRSALTAQIDPLREIARRTAMMQSGFDFFGRLRVERGMFNLSLYGIGPIVANVRIMTVRFDIQETATTERIRGLLYGGRIDVELAERLLRAWHCFCRHAIQREIAGENGILVDVEEFGEDAEHELHASLEAVGSLQKIVYSSISGQG